MVRLALSFLAWILAIGPVVAQDQSAPPEPKLRFVFEELVTLASDVSVGETAYGKRNIVPITGGTFEGPGIRGEVLAGGWDWQLFRNDGCLDITADYMLRTDDGAVINVRNTGVACRPGPGNPGTRTHAVFEPPMGKYSWLGKGAFVGTLVPTKGPDGGPAVKIRFYRVE